MRQDQFDYSASGLLGAVDTVMLSAPIPGIIGMSGEAAVDANLIFKNGFEPAVPSLMHNCLSVI